MDICDYIPTWFGIRSEVRRWLVRIEVLELNVQWLKERKMDIDQNDQTSTKSNKVDSAHKSMCEWISIEESLPKIISKNLSKEVIITDGKNVQTGNYYMGTGWMMRWRETDAVTSPTHWMLLPSPPK